MLNVRHREDDPHVQIRTFGVTFRSGHAAHMSTPTRAPEWHKLIYATRGVLTVESDQGAWVVPPHRAVWIRSGVDFRVRMSGAVAMRLLYIRPGVRGARLPRETCSVVNVTPLLRELIVRAVVLGALDARKAEQKRMIGVIFDELRVLHAMPLQLPMPRDPRAARFAGMAEKNLRLDEMLRACGASRRTLERLFRAETSMSLGQWLRRRITACAAKTRGGRGREQRGAGTRVQRRERVYRDVPPGVGTDASPIFSLLTATRSYFESGVGSLTSISSTSKIRSALGGILPRPFSP
jgi:AraC-like DNA-binding protein